MWSITHPSLSGTELLELEEDHSAKFLRGWVVALVDGVGCAVEYEVAVDQQWVTREVDVTLHRGYTRTLEMEHDGDGGWTVDGVPGPDLDGCLDVDLGVSPSTNTLPIRRLRLGVGEEASLHAVWVRFPDLVVEVLPQSYQRKAESIYRYQSDSFEADLVVDDQGVVLRYGDSLWQTVALS
jgi:hypothetical protein